MVDFETVRALIPHYVAMLVLAVVGVTLAQAVLGDPPAPVVFVVVLAIVLSYPFVVRWLGYAPDIWE